MLNISKAVSNVFIHDEIPSGDRSKSRNTKGRYLSKVATPTLVGFTSPKRVFSGGSACAQCRSADPGNEIFRAPEAGIDKYGMGH